jgi:UDP-N-acetylglucosamine 2-epimerase (non-hydrolysing)
VPGRPNRRRGWVRSDLVEVCPVANRIVVDRGARTLEVRRIATGKLLLRTVVAVGKSGAETLLGPQQRETGLVLVQGDTTAAAVGALAGFYGNARVGHVEAGLRSHEPREPFPEEVNRRVAGVIADLHFAPTDGARDNLLREGVQPQSIVVTGNPVIDALQYVAALPSAPVRALETLSRDRRIVLLTAHRRESFGAPLERICSAVAALARRYADDIQVVFPVHPNPAVRETVGRRLTGISNVALLGPFGYGEMVEALERCHLVLTDSGGLQEKAPGLGKPVLVLRDVTERQEGVEAGTVRLVGTHTARIVGETAALLECPGEYDLMARAVNPYGDGRAASRIVGALLGERVRPLSTADERWGETAQGDRCGRAD